MTAHAWLIAHENARARKPIFNTTNLSKSAIPKPAKLAAGLELLYTYTKGLSIAPPQSILANAEQGHCD